MSRRRRRGAVTIDYNEGDDSDNEVGRNYALDIFLRIASIAARGRSPTARGRTSAKRKKSSSTPARTSRGRRSVSAGTNITRKSRDQNSRDLSVVSVDFNPIDDGEYEERVRNRVNSHFKSSILLISDDEDEVPPQLNKPIASQSRFSKSFYVLSDSDDDDDVLPSTSIDNTTSHGPDVQNRATQEDFGAPATTTADSNRDELLEVVDDILECTDTPVKAPENVEDWKAKTDELIGDVDAIMKELYEKTGTKQAEEPKKEVEKVEKVKESPPKEVRACPVCFEVLGGAVQSATTLCGHLFCLPCITQVAMISKKCPTCRKAVTVKKIVPIYL